MVCSHAMEKREGVIRDKNHCAGLCVALKLNTVTCDWNREWSCEGLGLFKCCYIDLLLRDKEHNPVPAVTLSMESVLDTSLGCVLRGMMCGASAWLLPEVSHACNWNVSHRFSEHKKWKLDCPVAMPNILVWWLLLIDCAGKAGVMLERLAWCWKGWRDAGKTGVMLERLVWCWKGWCDAGKTGVKKNGSADRLKGKATITKACISENVKCWRAGETAHLQAQSGGETTHLQAQSGGETAHQQAQSGGQHTADGLG